MPRYTCRLGTSSGAVVIEEMTAPSEAALKTQLENKGFFVFSIRPVRALGNLSFDFRFSSARKKVPMREFILFNQEFAALLKAGLPVLTAFDLLLARKQKGHFQTLLRQVRDEVQAGASLSDAFANRGGAFPAIYSATLAAGERSGELVSVIKRYLFYLQTVQTIRKKIVSAMIYPLILLTLSICLVVLLLTVIVPKFSTLFLGAGAKLPALTEMVLAVSTFMQYAWPFLLAAVVVAPLAVKVISARPEGKLKLAQVQIKLPVLGLNIRRYNVSQMCRTLGTLVAGGIPIVTALEVVGEAMPNEFYRVGLRQVKAEVLEGQALWSSLEKSKMMTDLATEMIEVGESTGALAEMLDQVSQFYDDELSTAVERFVALLEPTLLLVMAVVIAIVVLSVYMPLFSMYNLVG